MAAYAASKHAVVGMMRCAAAEYGPQGLRVNCINPGATGELSDSNSTACADRTSAMHVGPWLMMLLNGVVTTAVL